MNHLLLISIPLCVFACAAPDAQAVVTELCTIDEGGVISGEDPWVCDRMVARYATLLSRPPLPGSFAAGSQPVIAISAERGRPWRIVFDAAAHWDVATPERQRQFRASTGLHEAGHGWLDADFDGVAYPDTFRVKYGTPAPDWLDEAWAVWAEGPAVREQRLERVPVDATPSLATLVTMRHPEQVQDDAKPSGQETVVGRKTWTSTTLDPCIGDCDYLPDSLRGKVMTQTITRHENGRVDTTTVWTSREALAAAAEAERRSLEAEYFYPLSYSLLRYIRETGGEAAVRELIARYRADPTPRVEALAGLPGLPASIAALERGWHAFLAERRTEPE